CIRADGRHIKLIGEVDGSDAFLTQLDQGILTHIDVVNNGTGAVVEVQAATNNAADAGANFADFIDCSITSPGATALVRVLGDNGGRFPPRVRMSNCNIGSFATDGNIVLTDGNVDFLDVVGTLLPAPGGPSLRLTASFDGLNFGGSVVNGTMGAIPANPAIVVEPGAVIVAPGSTRPLLVQGVNVAGTLSGFTTADPEVLFVGNQGIRNSLFVADATFEGNTTSTTIVTPGAYVPIATGSGWVAGPEQARWSEAGGVWTYNGSADRDVLAHWSAAFTVAGGSAREVRLRLEKQLAAGGAWTPFSLGLPADARNRGVSSTGFGSTFVSAGDRIRLVITNVDDTSSPTVQAASVRFDAT
ncbi:MAG: hypothetical protein VYA51_12675, partial [Planctomycetota bacterium]|nr:hypothetical protein [Planctomycetota bacterium]